MIEIPEALTLSRQINHTLSGKQIINVITNHTPHKFAWYHGDPQTYYNLLIQKAIGTSTAYGGIIDIKIGDATLLLSDGVILTYHAPGKKHPLKHQLLLEFNDSSAVSVSVQMYGGIWCSDNNDELQYHYYSTTKEKPSPLSTEFNRTYFNQLISSMAVQKLSLKAFLATEQRIPGLGNGVLQDILWKSKLHPKRKISTLTDENREFLYDSIVTILNKITNLGGRDTEKDLFGNKGGYRTIMNKRSLGSSCPDCGGLIKKGTYLGGSVYYCDDCQIY